MGVQIEPFPEKAVLKKPIKWGTQEISKWQIKWPFQIISDVSHILQMHVDVKSAWGNFSYAWEFKVFIIFSVFISNQFFCSNKMSRLNQWNPKQMLFPVTIWFRSFSVQLPLVSLLNLSLVHERREILSI